MFNHLRIGKPWKQLLVITLVFLPQILLLLAGLLAGPETDAVKTAGSMSVNTLKWFQATSSLLFFLLPAFLFAVFVFRGRYFYFLGFKKADKQNMYVLAACSVLFIFPVVFWLGEFNRTIPLPEWMTRIEQSTGKQMEEFLKVRNWYDVPVNIIIIALLPAICEELFFRGALQRVLIYITRRPLVGIFMTALLFSTLHLQFAGFLPRMLLGIVLGILYWYSGSLWTSVLGHFIFNASQVLWVSITPEYINTTPTLPLMSVFISAVSVAAILYFYIRQSSITWARAYETDELNPHNQFIA